MFCNHCVITPSLIITFNLANNVQLILQKELKLRVVVANLVIWEEAAIGQKWFDCRLFSLNTVPGLLCRLLLNAPALINLDELHQYLQN